MKILSITFKNINNLKGEHCVDFEKAPLSHAGIFAIVGPTGSGKSTLLDVITLALFNQIPRFKKSISKSDIDSLGSVMTHHTDDATASITYSIKGNRYISSWSIAKTRTGKLKDYQMFLYDAAGTPMDLKKSEVPAKNEEIIGLKYDQFIKSIILSQGEFAKFLKAGKNERGQLLENITGTSIYRRLGIASYQKQKQLKEELEKLNEIKGVFQLLSDEERNTITNNIEKLKRDKIIVDKKYKQLNELKLVKEELLNTSKKLNDKNTEAEKITKEISAFSSYISKLITHDKITPLREDFADYKTAKENALRSSKNLDDYKVTYKTGEANLKKVIEDMSALVKDTVDKDNFKSVMSRFEKKVNNLDKDLDHLKQRGVEERKQINEKKENYSQDISEKETPDKALSLLKAHQSELLDILRKNKLDENSSNKEIQLRIAKQREAVNLLKEITHNYEHIAIEEEKIKSEEKKQKDLLDFQSKTKPLLTKDEAHIKTLHEKLELIQNRIKDQLKIASLEELRQDLKSGDPCPLCGALDHPYTTHLENTEISELEQSIQKTKTEINTKQELIDKRKETLSNADATLKICNQRITELKLNLKEGIKTTKDLVAQYTGKEKLNSKNTQNVYNLKKEKLDQAEIATLSLTELSLNKELIKSYTRLEKIGNDYKERLETRQSLFQESDVNVVTNQLQDQFTDANTSMVKSKTAIEKETKDLEGANRILASLESKLNPKINKLGFNNMTDIASNILTESEANNIRVKQDNLKQSQTKNTTEISMLTKQIDIAKQKDTHPKLTLEQLIESIQTEEAEVSKLTQSITEYSGQLKRDDEDKLKIKSKEEEIKKLNQELEKWSLMNNLIGDATGNKFANYSQGLTLQNLLVYSNKRLQHLSDRYLIDKPTGDGTLKVIDQYQGNIERSVSTLSGGETFLISLALALSLSDMASKNVSLDCLFIDEGFGTLDQDTLEVAMNTLEKLQSENQKTVGVISHVEALKERIKVQIVLEKNPQGYSKIRIDA